MSGQPTSETLVTTSIAGVSAAITQTLATYPFEYIKTWRQLPIVSRGHTVPEPKASAGLLTFYRGCSAALYGNAVKATVRFSVYNWALKFMADSPSQTSAPQVVVAAMITGLFESLTVVPFENIKTTIIERGLPPETIVSNKHTHHIKPRHIDIVSKPSLHSHGAAHTRIPNPAAVRPAAVRPAASVSKHRSLFPVDQEIKGFAANVRDMYKVRGIRAFCQGFNATVTRQIGNSIARFGVYNFLKQLVHPANEPTSSFTALGLGLVTGGIQAVVTQPIDVVKTRMQSTNGIRVYGNMLFCAFKIFSVEGPQRLWAGLVPRFLKISFGGGVTFLTYEATSKFLAKSSQENPFSWQ